MRIQIKVSNNPSKGKHSESYASKTKHIPLTDDGQRPRQHWSNVNSTLSKKVNLRFHFIWCRIFFKWVQRCHILQRLHVSSAKRLSKSTMTLSNTYWEDGALGVSVEWKILMTVISLLAPQSKLNCVHGLLVRHIFILSKDVFKLKSKAQKSGLFSWHMLALDSILARKHVDMDRTVQSWCTKIKAQTLISYSFAAVCWLSAPPVRNI